MPSDPVRVLLMEDDAGLARLCRLKLLKAGYAVTVAANGEKGLAQYDAEPCDVVVLDQNMPVCDGLEVLRRLASRGPFKPVVMVTGAGSERTAVEAMKLGARDYVIKDADGWYLDLLPTVIERALQQQRTEAALRDTEARLSTLFGTSPTGILVADIETRRFHLANPTICRMLGYGHDELMRLGIEDIHPKEDLPAVISAFEAQMRGQTPLASDLPCLRKDGSVFYADINGSSVMVDGRECLVGYFTDITERRQGEEAARLLASIVESSSFAIFSMALDGVLSSWNAGAERLYGYAAAEVLGRHVSFLAPPDLQDEVARLLESVRSGQKIDELETERLTKSGSRINVALSISPVLDRQGQVVALSTIARDITKRKTAEEALRTANRRLQEMATTDELTGLWNRRHCMSLLGLELARARRQGTRLAVILFDVDQFKTVNDTCGHSFGDTVLATIGETLRAVCRLSDVAGRYGGDEFLVLAPGTSEEEANAAGERIRTQVAARVLRHNDREVRISLSVGVASVAGAEAGTPEALIARADTALYAAKAAGRGCVRSSGPAASEAAPVEAAVAGPSAR